MKPYAVVDERDALKADIYRLRESVKQVATENGTLKAEVERLRNANKGILEAFDAEVVDRKKAEAELAAARPLIEAAAKVDKNDVGYALESGWLYGSVIREKMVRANVWAGGQYDRGLEQIRALLAALPASPLSATARTSTA